MESTPIEDYALLGDTNTAPRALSHIALINSAENLARA
jgi:hypothetical protein